MINQENDEVAAHVAEPHYLGSLPAELSTAAGNSSMEALGTPTTPFNEN